MLLAEPHAVEAVCILKNYLLQYSKKKYYLISVVIEVFYLKL